MTRIRAFLNQPAGALPTFIAVSLFVSVLLTAAILFQGV